MFFDLPFDQVAGSRLVSDCRKSIQIQQINFDFILKIDILSVASGKTRKKVNLRINISPQEVIGDQQSKKRNKS